MSNEIKLLDCTLRDGGYLNDWEFGRSNIVNIFERLVSAGIDIIETGFLDDRRSFDENRSIFPDTKSVDRIYGKLAKGNSMIVGMIDYGTCSIDRLEDEKDSYLDGIRVIFKKQKMHEAIDFCRKVKEKGYKVFAQAVSITSYNDDELSELAHVKIKYIPLLRLFTDEQSKLLREPLLCKWRKITSSHRFLKFYIFVYCG